MSYNANIATLSFLKQPVTILVTDFTYPDNLTKDFPFSNSLLKPNYDYELKYDKPQCNWDDNYFLNVTYFTMK